MEEKSKQQLPSDIPTSQNTTSDSMPKIKEQKIRVGEDTPSQFQLGELPLPPLSTTDKDDSSLLPSGANLFDGVLSFSTESVVLHQPKKKLGVEDEKEKSFPLSDPVKPPLKSTSPIKIESDVKAVAYPLLKQSLKKSYRDKHTLPMPLTGKPFPIQAVSLTINEKSAQELQQRRQLPPGDGKEKKEREHRKENHAWSNQLQREEDWYKVEKPLEIPAIFKATSSAKPIQRVLIEGRAGAGKTTLSQYIAWQWAEHGLFQSDYDYLLLVPLRRWLSGPATENFQEELAAFIHESYFATETTAELLKELEAILTSEQATRTLLILDGFDEVAHYLDESNSPHGKLLTAALQFKNLLVTTRDYQLPPAQFRFDRQLVNIGLANTQIKQYLQCLSLLLVVSR